MKTVLFVADFETFKAGDHVEVDLQIAVDAIAGGFAVPSVDQIVAHATDATPPADTGAGT